MNKRAISALAAASMCLSSFLMPLNTAAPVELSTSAVSISDFPEEYQYAADWIWTNRIEREKSTERRNTIFDQIDAGKGTINYVVKWQSYRTVTYEQRQQFEKLLSDSINAWNDWLAGYDGWKYDHIDVKVVGWAVIDKSCLLDLHDDETVYTDTRYYDAQYDTSNGRDTIPDKEPYAPLELSRFEHFTDSNYEYPGGLDKRFDMYMWATQGFPDIGGCGGDWGQRLSDTAYLSMIDGTGIHVLEHEIGHGFGMTDFYGGEGETDGFPPGGFPGGRNSIMMAGSAAEITDFDGWMLRYMWSKIKNDEGRFDLSTPEMSVSIKGDINADGSFNIADVVLFQKWLLAVPDTHLADWKAADFCNDDRLDVFDLCLMRRALLAENTGDLKTLTVPLSENNAKLIGRTLKTDGITWLVHSGSAAEFTINGTEASVTICGDSGINSDEKYRPRYGVYVDGKLVKDVVMGEKEQTVKLFSGTASRTATVRIIHLSEANNGCIGVKDLTVTSSSSTPVKPTPKKELMIEFIGDSITCAYGVEAGSQYESFSTATENFTLSYAYLTAQLLDADYSAVCYSGHGIVSGYTNDGTKNTDSLVPPYYEMVGKPKDYQTQWDFSKNPADVIVLNLGTNDDSYASKELETRGAEYQELYEHFLKQIRKCNPDANIICTLGIMGATELYPYIEAAVNEVGDPKITCYESPVQDMNDLGADWHPSSKTHEKNAYLLADKISTVLGRPSDKIGIDLAADSKLESDIITESGANAWPYYAEWNRSMNVNISAAGNSPESITVYVPNLVLPTGKYELSFKAEGLKGEIPYEVRSMKDPKTVYASGTTETETTLKAFDLCESADDAEIVFMIGEQTGSITFSDVTLYKRANL